MFSKSKFHLVSCELGCHITILSNKLAAAEIRGMNLLYIAKSACTVAS